MSIEHIAAEIELKKSELAAIDYKCMKHADGELTDEEYEPIRQHRHELRQRINELEAKL